MHYSRVEFGILFPCGRALLYGEIQVVLVDITFLLLIHNVFLSLSLFVLSIRDFVMALAEKGLSR